MVYRISLSREEAEGGKRGGEGGRKGFADIRDSEALAASST